MLLLLWQLPLVLRGGASTQLFWKTDWFSNTDLYFIFLSLHRLNNRHLSNMLPSLVPSVAFYSLRGALLLAMTLFLGSQVSAANSTVAWHAHTRLRAPRGDAGS